MAAYPWTVHDLWLALTRLPAHLQSMPLVIDGRGKYYHDLARIEERGPDGCVALIPDVEIESACSRDELAQVRDDVLKLLTVFEMAVLNPPGRPPPPPIPITDAVVALIADIRERYEQVEDAEDDIPF